MAEPTEAEDIGADVTSLLVDGSAVDGMALCEFKGEILWAERVATKDVALGR